MLQFKRYHRVGGIKHRALTQKFVASVIRGDQNNTAKVVPGGVRKRILISSWMPRALWGQENKARAASVGI